MNPRCVEGILELLLSRTIQKLQTCYSRGLGRYLED